MAEFDPATLSVEDQYKLISGSVIPRPIALTVSLGPDGPNAAPFSFFNVVAMDPPMVMIACSPKSGPRSGPGAGDKDTVRNIKRLGEYVVHIVHNDLREGMNVCAIDYAYGVSEPERAAFTLAPSRKVAPPRIVDCRVQFECRLADIRALGRVPYHLIIGEAAWMHFDDTLLNERLHVDSGGLEALGRLAGNGG
ncbi:MAG: flavin reductase family protein [Alphaproteobacteria bacterium]|nr:flavin reductase family protein [Alphaproteobacteria bacterium]